jgi:exopolyphosphatase/guanosine-5'-triphosphate,3'-diphosphate pyrophosphatase
MRVGVVDVGSNTVRLLVTAAGKPVLSQRAMLRLGADVERYGRIRARKIAETAEAVSGLAAAARDAGAERLELLIASPGRQAANGGDLLDALTLAARCPARILSAAEEGRLAFVGAVSDVEPPPHRTVAVLDVGGGSAQLVVGSKRDGPRWSRSIDIGSQRLTSRLLSANPPGADAVAAARAEVDRYLAGVEPPTPRTCYAVGGSARAAKRIAGPRLGADELATLLDLVARSPAAELVGGYGVKEDRSRTLAAGVVILAAFQAMLDTPLKVVRGGVRDGAAAELAARRAAA